MHDLAGLALCARCPQALTVRTGGRNCSLSAGRIRRPRSRSRRDHLQVSRKERTLLNKHCRCGAAWKLRMRTVVYARKVKITRVPVLCCKICGSHEVYAGVKADIGKLIGRLGAKPEAQSICF